MSRSTIAAVLMAGCVLCGPVELLAQSPMRASSSAGTVQLVGTDAAVLDTEEIKRDLPCVVTPVKPQLGFDMRFHSGYDILVPLRELSGEGNDLTIIFRVNSSKSKDSPVYFTQHYSVPELEDEAKGDALLQGGFDLGEGEYHVDWMMRDRMERVCSQNWDVTAALTSRDQGVKLTVAAESVEASDKEFFKQDPPVTRVNAEKALNVKILINFAPQQSFSSTMAPIDTSALVSILRNISREPAIYRFSVVAFNMNEQRVVYRQDETDQIDFPQLGKALSSIKPGIVEYKHLADKHSGSDFLAKLIFEELGNNKSDAVIFAGPKVAQDDSVSSDDLKELAAVSYPVFYMNYNLTPQQNPWRDPIGVVVKRLRGFEYTISRPRDLWTSWSDIIGRISKLKLVATSAPSNR